MMNQTVAVLAALNAPAEDLIGAMTHLGYLSDQDQFDYLPRVDYEHEYPVLSLESFHAPTLFAARCGHRWIGSLGDTWACPECGFYNGDNGLTLTLDLDDVARAGTDTQYDPA